MAVEFVSGTGDWLLAIGLPIYLYALTRSTLTAATAMLVELIAGLAVGQVGGLLVDRFPRRPLMAVTTAPVLAAVTAAGWTRVPTGPRSAACDDMPPLWPSYEVSAPRS